MQKKVTHSTNFGTASLFPFIYKLYKYWMSSEGLWTSVLRFQTRDTVKTPERKKRLRFSHTEKCNWLGNSLTAFWQYITWSLAVITDITSLQQVNIKAHLTDKIESILSAKNRIRKDFNSWLPTTISLQHCKTAKKLTHSLIMLPIALYYNLCFLQLLIFVCFSGRDRSPQRGLSYSNCLFHAWKPFSTLSIA